LIRVFSRLRGKSAEPVAPAFTPATRMYCIGDIHGRADLLAQMHRLVLADGTDFEGTKKLLYLGDYIDRGESSKEVIEILLNDGLPDFETIFLRGNHEQALLDFLQHPETAAGWLGFGGLATLLSYGVGLQRPPLSSDARATDLHDVALRLSQALPTSHLEFFENSQLSYQEGSYCFVHAGIRPRIPLQSQHRDDLLWIRREFIDYKAPHQYIVVHGHTPVPAAEMLPNRIGLDTGSFYSGVLTCLVLEGGTQRLLQTVPPAH